MGIFGNGAVVVWGLCLQVISRVLFVVILGFTFALGKLKNMPYQGGGNRTRGQVCSRMDVLLGLTRQTYSSPEYDCTGIIWPLYFVNFLEVGGALWASGS